MVAKLRHRYLHHLTVHRPQGIRSFEGHIIYIRLGEIGGEDKRPGAVARVHKNRIGKRKIQRTQNKRIQIRIRGMYPNA